MSEYGREGAKRPTADSRICDLEREAREAAQDYRELCECLVMEESPERKATLLAMLAVFQASGRGARGQRS